MVRVPLLPSRLRWLGVAAVAGVIFAFSVVLAPPAEPVVEPPALLPLDKWRHFLAYAAFGGSLAYATTDWEWSTARMAVVVLGATVLYGVGVELAQAPLPGRYGSLGDAYANALGAVLVAPLIAVRPYLRYARIGES